MKHLFYVIYILFYTGAVFLAGMFLGQMLERRWASRERESYASSGDGVRDRSGSGLPLTEQEVALGRKR